MKISRLKNPVIKGFSIAVIACCLVIALSYFGKPKAENINSTEQYQPAEKPLTYTLGDYKGKIAVFEGKSEEPIEVFDILSKSLPIKDYMRVLEGIEAEDKFELQSLVEAYTS